MNEHRHVIGVIDGVKVCDECGYRECEGPHAFTCEERVVFCVACGMIAWIEKYDNSPAGHTHGLTYDPQSTSLTYRYSTN